MSHLKCNFLLEETQEGNAYTTDAFERFIVHKDLDIVQRPDCEWHIKQHEVLYSNDVESPFSVYRCEVLSEPQQGPNPTRTVIAKFGMLPMACGALEQEAMTYVRHLKEAQGVVVPRFLGFYKGQDADGDVTGILLLEDCGRSVTSREWDRNSNKVAEEACVALARFHQLTGLEYGNFEFKHLVKADGTNCDVKLVSFIKATKHNCRFPKSGEIEGIEFGRVVREKLPDPGLERIGCEEIHEFCLNLRLVLPVNLLLDDQSIPITSDIKTYDDAFWRVKDSYPDTPDEEIFEDIWCGWKEIEKHIEKYALVPWTQVKDPAEDFEEEDARIKEEEVMVEVGGTVEEIEEA
ncbi:hypothetical protein EWM64_g5836 [Hericium alpestre]|uniref:Uncharacterized protein n=1 Tax=Hericium alpestre TaxID=135208 RepID=A0A4Y9ZTE6_9AGAM|nr:hypothetical protein EWM64_g5836 [Hericium alpestre]